MDRLKEFIEFSWSLIILWYLSWEKDFGTGEGHKDNDTSYNDLPLSRSTSRFLVGLVEKD